MLGLLLATWMTVAASPTVDGDTACMIEPVADQAAQLLYSDIHQYITFRTSSARLDSLDIPANPKSFATITCAASVDVAGLPSPVEYTVRVFPSGSFVVMSAKFTKPPF